MSAIDPLLMSRQMKCGRAIQEAFWAMLFSFFSAKTATSSTVFTAVLSSPLILIRRKFDTAKQKIAKRRSYFASYLSIEKSPSLSRMRISSAFSTFVLKSIPLRPFVHRPALTWNLAPIKKLRRVDLPDDCGPRIVMTTSSFPRSYD